MNTTRKDILLNLLREDAGLSLNAFGIYLTVQANVGTRPWDVFCIGLSRTLGIRYGTASIAIAVGILICDLMMHEKIGLGMILDIIWVGKVVDFLNWLDLVPMQNSLLTGIPMLFAGMVILGYSYYLYMCAGLGCGPRDLLLIGLSKRLTRVPIGAVSIGILVCATTIGYLLHGPVGLGTLISAFCEGPIMEFAFRTVHFDPTTVRHQGIEESLQILLEGSKE